MTHFPVVVVTDSPDDLNSALAPFDECLDVTPHPETIGTVAERAAAARWFWHRRPQYVPGSVFEHYFGQAQTDPELRELKNRYDLGTVVTPGDKTLKSYESGYEDSHRWNNPAAAKEWLASLPDDVLALAYSDDYTNARIDGGHVVYDSTRNPNAHWDWWTFGGRWHGFFHVKPGAGTLLGAPGVPEMIATREGKVSRDYSGKADQLQWRDVDLDAMREHEQVKAEQEYGTYEEVTSGIEAPNAPFDELAVSILTARGLPTDWDKYLEATRDQREQAEGSTWRKPWDDAFAEAHAQWGGHPWVSALRNARIDPLDDPLDFFYCVRTGGRQEYIRRAVARAGVPYALVIKGEWIAKGRMGWFGMSADTSTQDEWNNAVHAFYGQLDGDVWVTAVDCHI